MSSKGKEPSISFKRSFLARSILIRWGCYDNSAKSQSAWCRICIDLCIREVVKLLSRLLFNILWYLKYRRWRKPSSNWIFSTQEAAPITTLVHQLKQFEECGLALQALRPYIHSTTEKLEGVKVPVQEAGKYRVWPGVADRSELKRRRAIYSRVHVVRLRDGESEGSGQRGARRGL